jgi:hypothetical protein
MREIVFRVTAERPGHLEATAAHPRLTVWAPSREEWHHEAREALIGELGQSHVTYRIRLRGGGGHGLDRIPAGGAAPAPPRVKG